MALVRHSAAHADPCKIADSAHQWNDRMLILEWRLRQTGAFAAGAGFSLADIVLGLSANRWLMTPLTRPDCPEIDAWLARMAARPGFAEHCRNGTS